VVAGLAAYLERRLGEAQHAGCADRVAGQHAAGLRCRVWPTPMTAQGSPLTASLLRFIKIIFPNGQWCLSQEPSPQPAEARK
jgi:hypothetical protein